MVSIQSDSKHISVNYLQSATNRGKPTKLSVSVSEELTPKPIILSGNYKVPTTHAGTVLCLVSSLLP